MSLIGWHHMSDVINYHKDFTVVSCPGEVFPDILAVFSNGGWCPLVGRVDESSSSVGGNGGSKVRSETNNNLYEDCQDWWTSNKKSTRIA